MTTAFIVFLLLTTPATAGALAIIGFGAAFVHSRFRLTVAPIARRIGFLFAAAAVVATLEVYYFASGSPIESLKLLACALVFTAGAMTKSTALQQFRWHVWISALVIAYYVVFRGRIGPELSQSSLLFFPNDNQAAVLVCVLAPVVLAELNKTQRVVYFIALFAFSVAVDSRFVVLTLIVLVLTTSVSGRVRRGAIVSALVAIQLVADFREQYFATFSDEVRLRIWRSSLRLATSDSFSIFNSGEAAFTDRLNTALVDDGVLSRRLEVSHAHNLVLHLWNSYGLVTTALWIWAIVLIVTTMRRHPANGAFAQAVALVLLAQIEAIISDARVMYVILFLIGARIASVVGDGSAPVARAAARPGRELRRVDRRSG